MVVTAASHALLYLRQQNTHADSPWCEPRPTHASRQHVKTIPTAVNKKKYDAAKLVKGESAHQQPVTHECSGKPYVQQDSDSNHN